MTVNVSFSDYKCGSCTLYIVLFVVFLVASVIISAAFNYFHWYLKDSNDQLCLKNDNVRIKFNTKLFFNRITNIKNFDPSLLSIDQVSFKKCTDCVIYYINISKILIIKILSILF